MLNEAELSQFLEKFFVPAYMAKRYLQQLQHLHLTKTMRSTVSPKK